MEVLLIVSRNKKKIGLLLMMVMMMCMSAVTAYAYDEDAKTRTSQDRKWHYAVSEDGKAVNVTYVGKKVKKLTVPKTIDGYEVKEFVMLLKGKAQRLFLPAGLEEIYANWSDERLYETGLCQISVEKGNKNYFAKDGVLYAKATEDEGQILLWYPSARKNKSYKVLRGTEYINGLGCNQYLREITYPGSLKELPDLQGYDENRLRKITLGEGTASLEDNIFYGYESLEELVLPKSLVKIGGNILQDCPRMKKLTIKAAGKLKLVTKDGTKKIKTATTKKGYREVPVYKSMRNIPTSCKVTVTSAKIKKQMEKAGCRGKIVIRG